MSDGDLGPTVQPAASAGATLRVIMLMGKFQGVMQPTTPTCRHGQSMIWAWCQSMIWAWCQSMIWAWC